LPAYAAGNSGSAVALNNHADACGIFFVYDPAAQQNRARGCAWIAGQFTDLGILPGCHECRATDINDAREVVGYCQDSDDLSVAFIWRDGVMRRLGDLLPPGSPVPRIARAINSSGQIAGHAIAFPPPPAFPHTVAFRLTPALPQTPGDTNCSSTVNIDDLLNVIANWNPPGPVGGNPCDVNRDNRINVSDLLEVIIHWTG
jgi:probable HAF family extracellular repeat protein